MKRCTWVTQDEVYIHYHDNEWGVPVNDDRQWFEFIVLDAFQAGLSWITVLKKRQNFRDAFDNFHPEIVATYTTDKIEALKENKGIIRNALKIKAAITNAQAFLKVQAEFGSFNAYIWGFVNHQTLQNAWEKGQVPAKTAESDALSLDLQKRGFKFVGSTICYAFMQAAGMVNDHTIDCFRHTACQKLGKQ